jgi:hypothetical protein
VVMVLAYMGVVIRDRHNLDPRCDHSTTNPGLLCLNPCGGFVRIVLVLPIVSVKRPGNAHAADLPNAARFNQRHADLHVQMDSKLPPKPTFWPAGLSSFSLRPNAVSSVRFNKN